MSSPLHLVRSVLTWPVGTQLGSRRNALVASTALTQRRREREEVEEFLAGCAARWSASLTAPAPQLARRDVI